METRSIIDFKEPNIRGPHLRYFLAAIAIAFSIVAALLGCFVWVAQIFR